MHNKKNRFCLAGISLLAVLAIIGCINDPVRNTEIPPDVAGHQADTTIGVNDTLVLWISANDEQSVDRYFWDLNKDGNWDANLVDSAVTYAWTDSGINEITVIARDNDGNYSDTVTITVTVVLDPPVINAVTGDTSITTDDTLVISVSASDDDSIAAYYFNFDGDSTWDSISTDSIVTYAWADTGTDTVKIKVMDGNGVFSAVTVLTVSVSTAAIEYLAVTTSDYVSGNVRTMLASDTSVSSNLLSVCNDNRIKANGGYLYILERFGADNILKMDPADSGAGAVVYQNNLGSAWNPADIVFPSEGKAFISLTNYPVLLEINTVDGSVTDSVDLRGYVAFAGTDSAKTDPDADKMVVANGKIYLLVQRLNGYVLGDTSKVLVIDPDAKTVDKAIPLRHKNPGSIIVNGTKIYVGCAGDLFGTATDDAAIEEIDISTDTWSKTAITESALGGAPIHLAVKNSGELYVAVYEGWGATPVKVLDIAAGTAAKKLAGLKMAAEVKSNSMGITDAYGGLAVSADTKRLFVGERATGGAGILVFSTEDDTKIAGPVSTGLPPNDLTILER